jgi:hypothetical protein
MLARGVSDPGFASPLRRGSRIMPATPSLKDADMQTRLALTLVPILALALAATTAFAGAPETRITPVAAADLPPAVLAVVTKAAPGLKVIEAELKEREDRRYFDVEGVLPGGAEIEFDLLENNGTWEIVETQRDIVWTDAPAVVRAAAGAAQPVRVIESTQNDGMVIYELFAPGQPKTPALEVSLKDGVAKVLAETWPH